MLVTSSIIPYLNILNPHMGPPTTPGPQASHHLNPALVLSSRFDVFCNFSGADFWRWYGLFDVVGSGFFSKVQASRFECLKYKFS